MKRIKMTVAYDGTGYCGWQLQPNGVTIEEILNGTLSELLKEPVCVIGASRTDSGVHALGNVAVFDTESRIPGEKLCYAVNQKLPEDIRVLEADPAPERFHSRLSASSKTYGYYVETGDKKNVFERKYVYGCGKKLDVKAMRQAAEFLIGEHDFKSFCANRRMKKSTVRRIDEIRIVEHGTKLEFLYTGNGFLYNMVRILTGTLLEVGSGTRRPEKMKEIIAAKNRDMAGRTAPPEGLFLLHVGYEGERETV